MIKHIHETIYSLIVLLFILSYPLYAEWSGLDTVSVLKSQWEFIRSIQEWNGNLMVTTGSTGLWMLRLDENDEFQIIDSLSVPENSEIYDFVIHGDTLAAALGDAAFLETILSPTEIGQAIYYPEVIVGSLAYDSNRYVFGIPGEKIVLASNNDGKMRILDSVFVEDAISLVVLEMDGGFIHL